MTDTKITLLPSPQTRAEIRSQYPDLDVIPLKLRLLKYKIADSVFCLGTTLLDAHRYPLQEFIDVYHGRWGIEELYKVSKRIFIIEDFHAKTERGVKQEIFAHFVLVTLNRLFANRADVELNPDGASTAPFLPAPAMLRRTARPISKTVFMSWTGALKSFSCFTSGSEASFSGSFVPSLHDINPFDRIAHSSVDPCDPKPNGIPVRRRETLKKNKNPPLPSDCSRSNP